MFSDFRRIFYGNLKFIINEIILMLCPINYLYNTMIEHLDLKRGGDIASLFRCCALSNF
jgi:hypothetical protein